MLPVDKIRRGQILSLVADPDVPLPDGFTAGTLIKVMTMDRNGIIGETKDGNRVELNGFVVLPQVDDADQHAFDPPGGAVPAGQPVVLSNVVMRLDPNAPKAETEAQAEPVLPLV
jgi:hypothetical protein